MSIVPGRNIRSQQIKLGRPEQKEKRHRIIGKREYSSQTLSNRTAYMKARNKGVSEHDIDSSCPGHHFKGMPKGSDRCPITITCRECWSKEWREDHA